VLFSIANLEAMFLFPDWETVPFHFIWVSLTILYGFRVWKARPTLVILAFVMGLTGALIWIDVLKEFTPLDELTEVPLMAAMFLAMVWHARPSACRWRTCVCSNGSAASCRTRRTSCGRRSRSPSVMPS
jgi:hypothetical protein